MNELVAYAPRVSLVRYVVTSLIGIVLCYFCFTKMRVKVKSKFLEYCYDAFCIAFGVFLIVSTPLLPILDAYQSEVQYRGVCEPSGFEDRGGSVFARVTCNGNVAGIVALSRSVTVSLLNRSTGHLTCTVRRSWITCE
jgi:hypothetical protein